MPHLWWCCFRICHLHRCQERETGRCRASIDNQSRKIIDRLDASEYFTVTQLVGTTDEAQQPSSKTAVPTWPSSSRRSLQTIPTTVHRAYRSYPIIPTRTPPKWRQPTPNKSYPVECCKPPTTSCSTIRRWRVLIILFLASWACCSCSSVPWWRPWASSKRRSAAPWRCSSCRPCDPSTSSSPKPSHIWCSLLILGSVLLISRYILDVPITGKHRHHRWRVAALHLASTLSGTPHQYCGTDSGSGTAHIGYDAAHAVPHAFWHDLSHREHARHPPMVSAIVPARWYITAIRKLMIMGVDFSMIRQEVIILLPWPWYCSPSHWKI